MKTKIIKVGNSKGIRLQKFIIEQCGFKDFIDIEIQDSKLIITPEKSKREGWGDRFSESGIDDDLVFKNVENEFDKTEWQW